MGHRDDFEGKDLEEALAAAAAALGVPEAELHYEMIEQGRRGVFGLGAKSVRIRIVPSAAPAPTQEPQHAPAPPRSSRRVGRSERSERGKRTERRGRRPGRPARATEQRPEVPVPDEALRKVEQTTQRIVELMALDVTARCEARDGGVTVFLEGPDEKLLKKRRNNETPQALQFVLNRMTRRAWPQAGRVRVATAGRSDGPRDDELIELTREVAQQVARTGQTKKLHPMNAYERRLVHLTVREYAGLTSSSDGEGTLKRVRIAKVQNQL
jgi:spoIIIJ-associated protein